MEFEEVFAYIGDIGLYQIGLYSLIGIPSVVNGMQVLLLSYALYPSENYCSISQLANFSHAAQKYIAIPCSGDSYSSCEKYDRNWTSFDDEDFREWNRSAHPANQSTVTCDGEWNYVMDVYGTNMISQWDLVCDNKFLVTLFASLFLTAQLTAGLFSGPLSDNFGRAKGLLISGLFTFVFTLAAAFAPEIVSFFLCRYAALVSSSVSFLCGFVLSMELVGPGYRMWAGVLFQVFFSCGLMLVPSVAYFARSLQALQLVLAGVSFVPVLFYFLLPESPRWLLNAGRVAESCDVLRRIALVNDVRLPGGMEENLKIEESARTLGFCSLLKSGYLAKVTLISAFVWTSTSAIYYSFNLSGGSLVGNFYLNNFLIGAVEVPANFVCILLLEKTGRRFTIGFGMFGSAVCLLGCLAFVESNEVAWLFTSFSLLGKSLITIVFSAIYVHTAEMFPTLVRNAALGACSAAARVGSVAAPYVSGPLADVKQQLPYVVFITLSVTSGFLICLLPETKGIQLPDSIEDMLAMKGRGRRREKANEAPPGERKLADSGQQTTNCSRL